MMQGRAEPADWGREGEGEGEKVFCLKLDSVLTSGAVTVQWPAVLDSHWVSDNWQLGRPGKRDCVPML